MQVDESLLLAGDLISIENLTNISHFALQFYRIAAVLDGFENVCRQVQLTESTPFVLAAHDAI